MLCMLYGKYKLQEYWILFLTHLPMRFFLSSKTWNIDQTQKVKTTTHQECLDASPLQKGRISNNCCADMI